MNAPTTNKPIAFGRDHLARCTVLAFVEGRGIDLRLAVYDFEAVGFLVGAELVRAFQEDILGICDPRSKLRLRLFRFKLARRWNEFVRELAAHRASRAA